MSKNAPTCGRSRWTSGARPWCRRRTSAAAHEGSGRSSLRFRTRSAASRRSSAGRSPSKRRHQRRAAVGDAAAAGRRSRARDRAPCRCSAPTGQNSVPTTPSANMAPNGSFELRAITQPPEAAATDTDAALATLPTKPHSSASTENAKSVCWVGGSAAASACPRDSRFRADRPSRSRCATGSPGSPKPADRAPGRRRRGSARCW